MSQEQRVPAKREVGYVLNIRTGVVLRANPLRNGEKYPYLVPCTKEGKALGGQAERLASGEESYMPAEAPEKPIEQQLIEQFGPQVAAQMMAVTRGQQPTEVAAEATAEVQAAPPAVDPVQPILEEEKNPPAEKFDPENLTDDQKLNAVVDAISTMPVDETHYTKGGSGVPDARILTDVCNFAVSASMRDAAYAKYLDLQSVGSGPAPAVDMSE